MIGTRMWKDVKSYLKHTEEPIQQQLFVTLATHNCMVILQHLLSSAPLTPSSPSGTPLPSYDVTFLLFHVEITVNSLYN